jgi:mono/diheme cytochrome c family protein
MSVRTRLCNLQMAAAAGLIFGAVSCADTTEGPTASDRDGESEESDLTEKPDASKAPPKKPSTESKPDGGRTADAGTTSVVPPEKSTDPVVPGDPSSKTWCAARAVIQERCQTCHGAEVEGAPMSIVTWADTQAKGVVTKSKTVAELTKARVHDKAKPMPPVAQGALTSEQLAAIDAWADEGFPDGACDTPDKVEPKPTDEFKWPAECTPDKIFQVKAHENGKPFNVKANWEDNVTIDIPVPWAGKFPGDVQAVAIRPLTANKRVVHHWILYAGALQFVTSWSPGKEAEIFPDDVGVFMPKSGNFQLNMHYYNQGNDKAEPDESGAEICITEKLRPKTATTKMFGPISLTIPPGKSEAVGTCTQNGSAPVTLITSSPHMHKTGVGGKFEIIRAGGKIEVLDDSPFDQEDQAVKPINAVLNRGDKVRTTCKFDNQTNVTKRFGESTEDEMCFNFSRYYPMGALNCSAGL